MNISELGPELISMRIDEFSQITFGFVAYTQDGEPQFIKGANDVPIIEITVPIFDRCIYCEDGYEPSWGEHQPSWKCSITKQQIASDGDQQ